MARVVEMRCKIRETLMSQNNADSVWEKILGDFFASGEGRVKISRRNRRRSVLSRPTGSSTFTQAVDDRRWSATSIADIERRSPMTVAIGWADSQLGHYGEQLWRLCVARRRAVCALSGMAISRGDSIYKPRTFGGKTPANSTSMILASILDTRYLSDAPSASLTV